MSSAIGFVSPTVVREGGLTLLSSVPGLLSVIKIPLTPIQQERAQMIDGEDYSGVIRKTAQDLLTQGVRVTKELLERGLLALKQYYAVALIDPCNRHAVSDTIDPFWHAHILHTRQYVAFCERVFGQYIHHEPLDHIDSEAVQDVARLYQHTYSVYQQIFTDIDPDFYPKSIPDARLVCVHYNVRDPRLRADGILPDITSKAA